MSYDCGDVKHCCSCVVVVVVTVVVMVKVTVAVCDGDSIMEMI